MSDKFQPVTAEQLASWIFTELETKDAIFGIPRKLFFVPGKSDPFKTSVYGQSLETPFGVAAGPHSQMAQNIIATWLCGARFIELKTIQTLDELEVSKPCIDMQDEGYNVEWSQELKIRQSFDEYLRAWVLIHALHKALGFPGDCPGVVFNMSVGYNMEGILKPNVQWFLQQMNNAAAPLAACVEAMAAFYPPLSNLRIPGQISDNVTLSTMHGCPPDEIEKISLYLIQDRGLHTNVKMNPTLLGPERLRGILNHQLGFKDITVPDEAFGHDLKYPDAVRILHNLGAAAKERKVHFGVKLSNTLEVRNHRKAFDPKEKMMYMSGRPLHAVTVNLAAQLADEFKGELAMSFSAGADAFNVVPLLACGMKTVTVCSDILRTGGYLRMIQYMEETAQSMKEMGAGCLDAFMQKNAIHNGLTKKMDLPPGEAARLNLRQYAETVAGKGEYKMEAFYRSRTKTSRKLGWFDCIMAPCTDDCPIQQKVPQYMRLVREGRMEEAIDVTREDNPLPAILGRACNRYCENVCVRTQLDEPLAIREMKRFIMDQEKEPRYRPRAPAKAAKVAVIGGGPCGLSVAYFLLQAGYPVTLFEARAYTGGMVSGSIPGYRATRPSIDQDLRIIKELGVEIRHNQQAGRDFILADLKKQGFKYIAIAAGAQKGQTMDIEGERSEGVLDGLEFLRAVLEQKAPPLGSRVGIVGGGDVAMDCARTAARLTGGKVFIIYRRTIDQMPAQLEEIRAAQEEGIDITELAAPNKVIHKEGKLVALQCMRMKLGEPDASGRKRPVEVPGSEFEIPMDHLIVAIGQKAQLEFLVKEGVAFSKKGYIQVDAQTMETSISGVYAGGDAILAGPGNHRQSPWGRQENCPLHPPARRRKILRPVLRSQT
ncbi:MAG: FAD-dependent oxidoreductase [Lentisphaerota bacterium]